MENIPVQTLLYSGSPWMRREAGQQKLSKNHTNLCERLIRFRNLITTKASIWNKFICLKKFDSDQMDTRYSLRLNFYSGQKETTTVLFWYTRPEICNRALFAWMMYMNFTKAFPTDGTEYPQTGSGRGITIFYTGPYF